MYLLLHYNNIVYSIGPAVYGFRNVSKISTERTGLGIMAVLRNQIVEEEKTRDLEDIKY